VVLVATYEYECEGETGCSAGGEVITITRGMTEPESEYNCVVCGYRLKRIYSAPPVKFNGTGFYSTGG